MEDNIGKGFKFTKHNALIWLAQLSVSAKASGGLETELGNRVSRSSINEIAEFFSGER